MMTFPRIVNARHVEGHVMWLEFEDGACGEVDLADSLDGTVFEPLRDPAYFRGLRVDPDLHTVVWPNGADFAPEFLRERLRAR
jgi:hypothetical protein